MTRSREQPRHARRRAPASAPVPRVAPLSLSHPTWIAALAVAASAILLSVTFLIYEKDFWQHLAVGRALWRLGHVPTTQIWTWPTYGQPGITPSWGFRLLLRPVWDVGGVLGLFAWRWLTTLVVFGLGLVTARRLDARGFTPLVVLVVCALTYRQRSQVRPETLASVWLALTIAALEWRRSGWNDERLRAAGPGRDPALLFPLIAWAWIQTHLSYPLGFVVAGAYLLDAVVARRPGARGLARATLLGVAIVFVNPYGAAGVLEPFRFFAGQRDEPIFRLIPELLPLDLGRNWTNLLPLVLFGWPLLQLSRMTRREADVAEGGLTIVFVALAFVAQRFLGFTMVVAAPFLARDLDAWIARARWPRFTASAGARGGLAAAACLLVGVLDWRRPEFPIGVGLERSEYPITACDVMAREGVRGRGFNQFYLGGYLLERFWPDRGRLPFIDIHQTGTREDRNLYAAAMSDPRAWRALDDRHRFDWVLLRRVPYAGDFFVEHLDADSTFALIFMDDAAALWVRRRGPMGGIASRLAYHELPAGVSRLSALGAAATTDPMRRAPIVRELLREAAGSPFHAQALGRLGSLELAIGDLPEAERHLRGALAVDPHAPRAHERLGLAALALGRPREALDELRAERRLSGAFPR